MGCEIGPAGRAGAEVGRGLFPSTSFILFLLVYTRKDGQNHGDYFFPCFTAIVVGVSLTRGQLGSNNSMTAANTDLREPGEHYYGTQSCRAPCKSFSCIRDLLRHGVMLLGSNRQDGTIIICHLVIDFSSLPLLFGPRP